MYCYNISDYAQILTKHLPVPSCCCGSYYLRVLENPVVLVLYQRCKNASKRLQKLNCQLLCIIISTDEHFVSRLTLAPRSFGPSFLALQSKNIFQLHFSFTRWCVPKHRAIPAVVLPYFSKITLEGRLALVNWDGFWLLLKPLKISLHRTWPHSVLLSKGGFYKWKHEDASAVLAIKPHFVYPPETQPFNPRHSLGDMLGPAFCFWGSKLQKGFLSTCNICAVMQWELLTWLLVTSWQLRN